jgi:hypothetical protein
MPHLDWRVAGAAGLAAGLTVGGFSLVSASGIDQAVNAAEATESRAAPAAESFSFVTSRTTTPPAHIVDLASHGVVTVEMPPAPPAETIKLASETTQKPARTTTPKPAAIAHVDDCASCTDCTDDCASCNDATNGLATCVDSVASAASVASVDSDD